MKKLAGLFALAALLSFGTVTTVTYAGDPAPAPTDGKDKDKKSGPHAEDEKKDKDGDKGGK